MPTRPDNATELEGPQTQQAIIPELMKALNDGIDHSEKPPLETIRVTTARTLGDLGPIAEPAVPALVARLKDDNGYVRVAAAVALWKINQHPAAGPALKTELHNETQGVRHRAEFEWRRMDVTKTAAPADPTPPNR